MDETKTVALDRDAYCPACGYNVRGVEACRCPECGEAFDPAKLSMSQIPWTWQRRVGYMRAFFLTVWLATLQARRMAAGGPEPLDRVKARWFGLICEGLLAVPICAVLLSMSLTARSPSWSGPIFASQTAAWLELWVEQLLGLWAMAAGWWPLALLLGLATAHWIAIFPSRLAAFPKYPVAQRENLIAGAHYLAGAIVGGGVIGAIGGVVVAGLALGTAVFGRGTPPWVALAGAVGICAGLVGGLLWLTATIGYFRQSAKITGTSMRRVVGTGVLLNALWLGVWGMLMPICTGLMVLIYRTW